MPKTFEVTVQIKCDGRMLPGFPLTRRQVVDGYQDVQQEHADDAAQTDLATDYVVPYNVNSMTNPVVLFVTADGVLRVSSRAGDAQGNFPIVLDANGFLLAVGLESTDASNGSFTTCNNTGATILERAIVAGNNT